MNKFLEHYKINTSGVAIIVAPFFAYFDGMKARMVTAFMKNIYKNQRAKKDKYIDKLLANML